MCACAGNIYALDGKEQLNCESYNTLKAKKVQNYKENKAV